MMLDVLDDESTSRLEYREVSDLARVINQDSNNYKRRHLKNASHLDPNCLDSFEE